VPAAIGTQVGGSIIRPAAFCGNIALKPTQGGIHRGERQGSSQSTAGVHANSFDDMWQVAIEISKRAGGDPGTPGLLGPETAPHPARPERLALLETEGWAILRPAERDAFEALVERIRSLGVPVLRRSDHPAVEALERITAASKAVTMTIVGFEGRWDLLNLEANHPNGLSRRAISRLRIAESITVEDYRAALHQREEMRSAMARLAPVVDALIAPAAPGIAPFWDPDDTQNTRPTGDIACNAATSALGVPCVTLPVLAVEGMPFGVQIIGQAHQDARVTAITRWLFDRL